MKKISLLLLRSYLGPFIISFFIWLFIFELQFVWKYIDDLIGKGLSPLLIGELLVYASAPLVLMALPVAILLSSIMTLGNLSEHFELTAMKSSGMSLFRIMRPLTIFIVLISIGAFVFSNNVLPIATLKFKTLLFSITKQAPTLNITPNTFYNDIDGFVIRAKENNVETGEMTDVLIYDHTANQGNRRVIRAERGYMNQNEGSPFMIVNLYDGVSYDEPMETGKTASKKSHPAIVSRFEENIIRIDISSLLFEKHDEDLFSHREEMMTIFQLENGIDSLAEKIIKDDNERHLQAKKSVRLTTDSFFHKVDSVIVDSVYFYDQLSMQQRERALDKAMNLTRKYSEYQTRTVKQQGGKMHRINMHLREWHRKFFFAASCIILFFVGAPLGAITRKGGYGFPTLIALGLFVLYYILGMVGEKMIKAGTLEPWLGMWLSSFILVPLAIFLTYKAATDSSITDSDFYAKLWSNLKGKFSKKTASE